VDTPTPDISTTHGIWSNLPDGEERDSGDDLHESLFRVERESREWLIK
jgi:hypothetical protein